MVSGGMDAPACVTLILVKTNLGEDSTTRTNTKGADGLEEEDIQHHQPAETCIISRCLFRGN